MRVVAALGGNALMRRGEAMTVDIQRRNVRAAAVALAPVVAGNHELVITHGNGPQVGLLALQAAAGPPEGAFPLDILDAESEGMIGYLIEQELRNALAEGCELATLLTQIRVDPNDKAFANPTKPVGPVYPKREAERQAIEQGWAIAEDGTGWRRVVPSPRPVEILEAQIVRLLLDNGVTVICVGGGGIPVVETTYGTLTGIEAVIDKDHASALLAITLDADRLLLLTDIDAVYRDWGGPAPQAIGAVTPDDLDPSEFAAGSMRPKIEAAISFVDKTGRPAAIGRLEDAAAMLEGGAGTAIFPAPAVR